MEQPVLLVVKIIAGILTLIVFELIRREKLKDQLAMMWFVSSLTVFILSLWAPLWVGISHVLGIRYEPSLFILGGLLFCVSVLLYLTVMFSKHEREKEVLSQQVGLLQWKLEQIEKKSKESA
ncbi:MAG: DUF2304 domain-containing protein [Candidatus Abyssobacteria bacterium SURF_17]|jgi:hypothetical protein|uniref:DUF2304 domain-containing protein n=1 Tax=Candidatus Abyssobacteria bacterium SURF_17 TaxID=2093361 RepID=A0A419ENJ8_9BACT|nr:MAG: DUF2304 domain-containing protein [Candidatus Abyssubacteria bacterium SURF_17]